jgi:hypothetical protein
MKLHEMKIDDGFAKRKMASSVSRLSEKRNAQAIYIETVWRTKAIGQSPAIRRSMKLFHHLIPFVLFFDISDFRKKIIINFFCGFNRSFALFGTFSTSYF